MVRVKVCGITSKDDALLAVNLGVDALGFIFAPSPRRITPEAAHEIIRAMPPFVKTVGVFVNESPVTIRWVIESCGIDLIQLHGEEPPDLCSEFMPHTIKAFQIKDESSLSEILSYQGRVRALLFDTYSKDKRGGTGKTFDWDLAAAKGEKLDTPIILSGGLTPSNITRAVSAVRPYAVDVNSGVEEQPGKKSPVLMREMMGKIGKINSIGVSND
jgi:phosphoribosylanthranilate isomerase